MKKLLLFWLRIILTLCSLFGFVGAIEQQKAELVKLPLGTKYEISNIPQNYPLKLPISYEAGVEMVNAKLLGVSFNNKNQQNLMHIFMVTVEAATTNENKAPALFINSNSKQLEQGTYQLLISIQEEGADNSLQILSLELTLPAAKLQQPGTLNIEQVHTPFSVTIAGKPKLLLVENSGHQTGLQNILIKQIASASENAQYTTATVNFDPLTQLLPGDVKEVAFSLSDTFPLGATNGTILIKSSQLAEPVTVAFKVNSHRHWGFIIFFLILGLVTGFATRIWAKSQIDLYNARSAARDAIRSLRREDLQYPDSHFKETIQSAIEIIERAANGTDIKVIENAIKQANHVLAEALTNLETRRADAKNLLNKLRQTERIYRLMPKEFADVLDSAALDLIEQDILAGHIASAHKKINDFISKTGENIIDILNDWRTKAKTFVQQLGEILPLLGTQSLADNLNKEVNNLSDKIRDIDIENNPSIEQIDTVIDLLKDVQQMIKSLLWQIEFSIAITSKSLKVEFSKLDKNNESTINELIEKLEQFQNKIKNWEELSTDKVIEVQDETTTLKSFWKETLLIQVKSKEADRKEVESLLEKEDFRGATLKVIQILSAPQETYLGAEKPKAVHTSFGTDFEIPTPNFPINGSSEIGEAEASEIKPANTTPPIFEVFKSGSLGSFIMAKTISFLVAGLGIVATGYILFADKFVGTFSDLLAIFIWAFGIDLSINAFMEVGKEKRQHLTP